MNERVSILLEDFGSRAGFASNKTDAASTRPFVTVGTVVGSGWRLKSRQLGAIDSVGEVCSIEATAVAAAHILVSSGVVHCLELSFTRTSAFART